MGSIAAVPRTTRTLAALAAALVAAALVGVPAAGGRWNAVASDPVGVIVRAAEGAEAAVGAVVERLGGTVTTPLPIISGFAADVPGDRLGDLARTPGVAQVTPDLPIRL